MSKVPICALAVSVVGLLGLGGCKCGFEEPTMITEPERAAPPCGPCGEVGMRKIARYLPGAEKRHSAVLLEKAAPERVRVGEAFEYHIRVTNLTKAALHDVTVRDTMQEDFKVTEATPPASTMKDGWMTWELGKLDAGQAKLIKIDGMASGVCVLSPCSEVTYRTESVCLPIQVVEPSLALTKTAPAKSLICDSIPMTFVVKNVGTGEACNVVIRDPLPEGLQTMDGRKELMFAAGTLGAGQSREFTAQLTATKAGTYVNKAVATADGGLRAEAEPTTTVVVKPDLSITKTGPEMRYVGRPITYTLTVINGPEATAANAVLTDSLPPGATFVSASDDGRLLGNQVVWSLGTLAPRDTRKVTLTIKGDRAGALENTVVLTASCGTASTKATTMLRGIPAILLEVVDLDDPVEVGSNATYVITVTNQGSAVDTNIVVECTLPPQQTHVKSTGPTEAAVKEKVVTFSPLASLAPKAKAVYKVEVKGVSAGDVRFKVALTSDQMSSPAEETEPTRIYE